MDEFINSLFVVTVTIPFLIVLAAFSLKKAVQQSDNVDKTFQELYPFQRTLLEKVFGKSALTKWEANVQTTRLSLLLPISIAMWLLITRLDKSSTSVESAAIGVVIIVFCVMISVSWYISKIMK